MQHKVSSSLSQSNMRSHFHEKNEHISPGARRLPVAGPLNYDTILISYGNPQEFQS
jgi:hypothetical protein